jgi:hypothetical protein
MPNRDWYVHKPPFPPQNRFTNIAVAANADGRLEIYTYEDASLRLFHKWQVEPNIGWSDWSPLGAVMEYYYQNYYLFGQTDLFVGVDAGLRQQLITQGDWSVGQTAADNGWGNLYRIQSNGMPAKLFLTGMAKSVDSRLYSFGVDWGSLNVYCVEQDSNGSWGGWQNFGHPTSADGSVPAGEAFQVVRMDDWNFRSQFARVRAPNGGVGGNKDGRIEIFGASPVQMWHKWQTDLSNLSHWSAWSGLGSPQPRIDNLRDWVVIQNEDGRLEVFAAGKESEGIDKIWHIWQDVPNGGWSQWSLLSDLILAPGWLFEKPLKGVVRAARTNDGRLMIFAIGQDGSLRTKSQLLPNGGTGWQAGWDSLGGENITAFDVGQNEDGRLEVFIISNGSVWHRWQMDDFLTWSTVENPAG